MYSISWIQLVAILFCASLMMPERPLSKRRGNQRSQTGRRRRACDSCSRKKIQCDTEFPQCNWCQHHNLACTYNRIRERSVSSHDNLHLRNKPAQPTFANGHHYPGVPGPSLFGSRRYLQQKSTFLNNVTYFRGHHIFSDEGLKWIESRVGSQVDFEKLFALELQWLKPLRLDTRPLTTPPAIPEFPNIAKVERYVAHYSSSFQGLVFPVISKLHFTMTLNLAYNPDRPSGSASARACVYSFLALVSLFGFDENIHDAMDCGSYASAALSSVSTVIQEMTIDGLQSLIMLVQLQYFLGDLQSAAVSLSIAARLLYALEAHTLPTIKGSTSLLQTYDKSDLRCHLRDLFWLCYSFDKDICLRTGQPPCINDAHCDLTLPPGYVQLQYANLQRTTIQADDHIIPLFPWDLRLSKLKSRVYEHLYSANSLHSSDSDLLSNIRSLDEELESWRVSLPQELRPTLCFSGDMLVSENLNTQTVMLRLAYYHCVTSIHQVSSRCHISGSGVKEPRFDGITLSTRLAIIASRSTLSYLQSALPILEGECFWVVIFYAITAVLTLFCNILSDPLDPDNDQDVDLLQNVPSLIRKIPIRKFTFGEVIHLKFLDGFTAELAGICVCAMSKA